MDHQRTLAQQLAPLLPLLRLPLLLNDTVAMILTWVAWSLSKSWNWYWSTTTSTLLVLAIVFSISLVQNAVLSLRHFNVREVKLLNDTEESTLALVIAAWDISGSITFLVLSIVLLCNLSSGWSGASCALETCAAIGALVACFMHFTLGFGVSYRWYTTMRQTRFRCPTCHQKMKAGAVVSSPTVGPMRGSPRVEAEASTMANEEGQTEGDRLITPGAYE